MNGFKRAKMYLIRKKEKSAILLVFLLVMATLMLTCLSIRSALDTVNVNIRKALLGYFTINAKQMENGITKEMLEKIMSIDGLSGNYTLRSYTYATYYDADGKLLEIDTQDAAETPEGYENAGKVVASSNSESGSYFTEAGFELIDGKAIANNEENVVLLHKEFAMRNDLTVGDTIMLGDVSNAGRMVEVRVAGLFTNTKEQESLGLVPSYDLYNNIIFTDVSTASYLIYGAEGETSVEYGDFYVDDPDELERIMKEVKDIEGVEWDRCVLTRYDNDYQNAKESLEGLQNIIFTAIELVFLICLAVLALFLTLRLRGRIRETGIYLAMGISKKAILMQYLAEILIIAAVALVLAYGTSSMICNRIGQCLFTQVTAESYATVDLAKNDTKEEMVEQEDLGLSEIEVSISAKDYQIVWMLTIVICVLSIAIASYPILRMKPKNILSQMS